MSGVSRRQFLREKEAVQLLDEFSRKLKVDVTDLIGVKKPGLESAEGPNVKIFYLEGKPLFAATKDGLIPMLLFEKALSMLPRITVNMGAVPYVCNGADVLAPGIVRIEGAFAVGDFALVVDERHGKPLAVVSALVDSQAASGLKRGKVAGNLHYVGDALWNMLRRA
jgi:PUA domain protein